MLNTSKRVTQIKPKYRCKSARDSPQNEIPHRKSRQSQKVGTKRKWKITGFDSQNTKREDGRAALPEGENPGSLHEEGPLLIKAGLECRQVHHRRVDLNLAEIRVDGGSHGEV